MAFPALKRLHFQYKTRQSINGAIRSPDTMLDRVNVNELLSFNLGYGRVSIDIESVGDKREEEEITRWRERPSSED